MFEAIAPITTIAVTAGRTIPDLGQGQSAGRPRRPDFRAACERFHATLHRMTSRIRIITETRLQKGLTAHDKLQFVWSKLAVFRASGMWLSNQ